MGLNIGEIVPKKSIEFSYLKGKVIGVDASNIIYQFLSTIRQPDGTPLQDKKGITSHLSGLFYRNINLLNSGLKLVYIFDGKPPELKMETKKKRKQVKEEARKKYKQAKKKGKKEEMFKYAQQLAKLTPKIVEESKELLKAMGIQVVQAPSEAESQASYMAKKRKVFGVASQDYDSLLFSCPRLIQNLTLSRRRKTVSGYIDITPQLIELERVLNSLGINQDQLICLGILAGTDYNPKGVVGIGQKRALEIVKRFRYPVKIFKNFENLDFDWKEVFELFHKPKIKDVGIKLPKMNENKVKKILLAREFSESRVESGLEKLHNAKEKQKQRTLF